MPERLLKNNNIGVLRFWFVICWSFGFKKTNQYSEWFSHNNLALSKSIFKIQSECPNNAKGRHIPPISGRFGNNKEYNYRIVEKNRFRLKEVKSFENNEDIIIVFRNFPGRTLSSSFSD